MIKLPVVIEYNDKGAKKAKNDLASLAKSYAASALSAGALATTAYKAVQGAMEEAKAQRILALAVQNNTAANANQRAGLEDYINKLQYSAAVSDDQLRPALGKLVTVTGSLTEAQDLLNTSIDIAAYTGKDLESVTASVSRAYQGNIGALRRLGLAVDTAKIKNKDFAGAWDDVKNQVKGANDEANKGAAGPWKRIGLAIKDAADNFGQGIIDFGTYAQEVNREGRKATTDWLDKLGMTGDAIRFVGQALKQAFDAEDPKLKAATDQLEKYKNMLVDTSSAAQALAFDQAMWKKQLDIEAAAKKKVADAAKAAAERAKELAKANRETLAEALRTAQARLEAVRQEMDAYAGSIRDAVSGFASLSDAYSTAQANEDAYQAALKDRADAYAELADLNKTVFDVATGKTTVANAEDLAAAYDKVAKAESAVTAAQGKRRDYTAEFSAQVAAAKQFSTDLQALAAAGLQAPGIQQLLNMGPVAGDAVAKDLLDGTKGITVGGLNADLAGLAASGQTLGNMVGQQVYGADLLAAQGAVGAVQQAQSMNVTINATSADPDKIVAAIVAWSKKNGKLPPQIKVA